MKLLLVLTALLLSASPAALAQGFSDIAPSDPYAESVQALADAGIIFGYPDGTFRGNQPVSRAELAVVLARLMKYYEAALPAGVSLSTPLEEVHQQLADVTPEGAKEELHVKRVEMGPEFAAAPDAPVTVQEVEDMVFQAFAQLIRMANPPQGIAEEDLPPLSEPVPGQ